jgi:putative Holliday junction resolvase
LSRILAVDWGSRRIGLALSDPSRILARPLPTLLVKSSREALEGIVKAARGEEVDTVLLGLPFHMGGEEGTSARRVRQLGESLRSEGFTILYVDERMSSEDAMAWLRERGERRPEKARIDQVAALLLLQGYLDAGGGGSRHA